MTVRAPRNLSTLSNPCAAQQLGALSSERQRASQQTTQPLDAACSPASSAFKCSQWQVPLPPLQLGNGVYADHLAPAQIELRLREQRPPIEREMQVGRKRLRQTLQGMQQLLFRDVACGEGEEPMLPNLLRQFQRRHRRSYQCGTTYYFI
eukprot:2830929-Pleurochrysis_carterae.AAC.1